MSKIGITEVERTARLARIELSPEEASNMSIELGSIVEFVEQLQQIDVSDVAPTDQVTGLEDVWREDVVSASVGREALLKNAPQAKDGYIVVRRVLNG